GRTGHAFLFSGGNSESREEMGMWLSEKILCSDELSHRKFRHGNHEDFLVVEKSSERETIVKEQILSLLERTEYKPYGDKYVVLIKDAHLMNEIAQNKLLKGLEEPVSQVIYILLAEREDSLLSTIRSRCTCFHLEEEKTFADSVIEETAEKFAGLICGKICYYKKKAVIQNILNDKDNQRVSAMSFLDTLEDRLEEGMLSGDTNKANAIKHLETARKYLLQGQSVAYTLKQLCLKV
ncbi:MAG: hypothetical protein J5528_00005, partial [Firmicutes bacterium]|nr:hypothetical protein [Bacillota bacterium]